MDYNALVQANEPLFNLILARFFEANPGPFSGNQVEVDLNIEFTFRAVLPPTIMIFPLIEGANFKVTFASELKTYDFQNDTRGALTNSVTVQIDVLGQLVLSGETISLIGLRASGTSFLDRILARIVNTKILPQYEQTVRTMPLPNFSGFMGMQVSIVGVEALDHILQVYFQASSGLGISSQMLQVLGPVHAAALQAALSGGGVFIQRSVTELGSTPGVLVAMNENPINTIIRTQFAQSVSTGIEDEKSEIGAGYRYRLQAGAGNWHVSIRNGYEYGSFNTWASASFGIQAFWQWTDINIPVSFQPPPLGVRFELANENRKVAGRLYMHGDIIPHHEIPEIVRPLIQPLVDAINAVPNTVVGLVNNVLNSYIIDIYQLPSTVPGTGIKADLKFHLVATSGNAVIALINLSFG